MTIEYVLIVITGALIMMSALLKAPKAAFEEGGTRLAARVETQLATGSGFKPYPGGSEDGTVPWARRPD